MISSDFDDLLSPLLFLRKFGGDLDVASAKFRVADLIGRNDSDREGEHATSVFCSSTCLNTIYLMKHSNTEKVVIDMFMVLESSNSKQSLDLEVNSKYPQGWVQRLHCPSSASVRSD